MSLRERHADVALHSSRTLLFAALLILVDLVGDGLPRVSTPLRMQMCLLPFTAVFLFLAFLFLSRRAVLLVASRVVPVAAKISALLFLLPLLFEIQFIAIFFYETVHFRELGYRRLSVADVLSFGMVLCLLFLVAWFHRRVPPCWALLGFSLAYVMGQALAIVSFPLNYLRSDMLPVIAWADRALLMRQDPYQHFHVAERIYDFPYLPGTMLTFFPAIFFHLDPRWASIAYTVGSMWLVYLLAAPEYRLHVAGVSGLFMLCPYLQYRHELYTQGHFFSLVLIFALMHRRWFGWGAAVFGVSMAISQFSWVIFPFFLLNGYRRAGLREVLRLSVVAVGSAFVVFAPFRGRSVAYNAVGQWDNLEHAIARPMNVSFWATYVVHPDHLKWIQLLLLSTFFCLCCLGRRCMGLADTLRCMTAALLAFILLNVLVDGYFYLMLLVPMLVYTCVANGWWPPDGTEYADATSSESSS